MEFPRDVVPVIKRPETSDTTSDQRPSTVSFGAVSSSSRTQETITPSGDEGRERLLFVWSRRRKFQ
eukprot:5167003-Amphidinium_carterae.1